jgi:hypothetical protein
MVEYADRFREGIRKALDEQGMGDEVDDTETLADYLLANPVAPLVGSYDFYGIPLQGDLEAQGMQRHSNSPSACP